MQACRLGEAAHVRYDFKQTHASERASVSVSARRYVRRQMGQRVPLRLTPMYIFEYDDAQEELDLVRVSRMLSGCAYLRNESRSSL